MVQCNTDYLDNINNSINKHKIYILESTHHRIMAMDIRSEIPVKRKLIGKRDEIYIPSARSRTIILRMGVPHIRVPHCVVNQIKNPSSRDAKRKRRRRRSDERENGGCRNPRYLYLQFNESPKLDFLVLFLSIYLHQSYMLMNSIILGYV